MIRVQGQTNGSHDPKLKVPLVGSPGARTAAERTVSTGDIAALRKEIAALGARVAALEVNSHVPVDFTPMLNRIAALEARPAAVNYGTAALMDEQIAAAARETKPPRETKPAQTKPQRETKPRGETKPQGGRPRKHDAEPWVAEGVSKATWHRRQNAQA
jgi:hypothetical protein